jgi:trimethyllysine dioxygenase
MSARIVSAVVDGAAVRVTLEAPPAQAALDGFWLRDHDESSAGLDPDTRQRRVDTCRLIECVPVESAVIVEAGRALRVRWADGSETRHGAGALADVLVPTPERPPPILWSAPDLPGGPPVVAFESVMDWGAGVRALSDAMARWGVCLVDGVPASEAGTERLVRRIGYPRETVFGGMWTFEADGAHADTAYSDDALPLHTDGTYTLDPPGWQILHCIHYDATGGDSLLRDGFAAAESLRARDPAAWARLCEIGVPAQYLGDGVHLRATHPVITLDAAGDYRRIGFNNGDRAPFHLPPAEMRAFYDAWRAFGRIVETEADILRFGLRPGRALVFDNWRVLHGRAAFRGERVLTGAYLNREDVESVARQVRRA